jgi:iron complex outermembrane recepter protein
MRSVFIEAFNHRGHGGHGGQLQFDPPRPLCSPWWNVFVFAVVILVPWSALAQTQPAPPLRIVVPTVVVTAQKEPADGQTLPVSVTAVSSETIASDDITIISDAAILAPNTYFSEFSARKLSFPHFRGVSSGPGNPAITTYIDGVPQLHTNASSVELVGVEQIELVRGPQSALFGRNALGGLMNVLSVRPALTKWTGTIVAPFGNFSSKEVRGSVSGPLTTKLAVGVAAGRSVRDGFTINDVTGRPIDNRSAVFGKLQLLWTPTANWEARAIVSGERDRDGDYALNDLGALRRDPYHAARDFEGRTDRDVTSATVLTRRVGPRVVLSTTTGLVKWRARDLTDLDYTPLPLVTRENSEEALQFTQEVRLASGVAPVRLSGNATLKWQAGVFLFTQGYDQDAINSFSPFVLDRSLPFAVSQHSPESSLDDAGVGVYGQGTITLHSNLDVTLGARIDHESKEATLDTFFVPQLPFGTSRVSADRGFSDVSPQASVAYRFAPDRMGYVSLGRGYKAGGFNAASPAGSEAFGEEHAWHVEGGMKTAWAAGKVIANASVFHIDWQDLQLNLPNPAVPAQFYVANVGAAGSTGVELELTARPHPNFDLFGVVGYTRGRFGEGSVSSGLNVSGNKLPTTPEYTTTLGAQYSRMIRPGATIYGRGEAVMYGSFFYDDFNSTSQDAYSLTNLRAGVRGRYLFVEAWVRNAFDTRYIPIAFPYGSPSGFVGEMGRPRTFGISAGVTF